MVGYVGTFGSVCSHLDACRTVHTYHLTTETTTTGVADEVDGKTHKDAVEENREDRKASKKNHTKFQQQESRSNNVKA